MIRTTGLKPMLAGLQQRSGDAVIVERWHLERDPRFGEILVDDLAVSDPPIFRGVRRRVTRSSSVPRPEQR